MHMENTCVLTVLPVIPNWKIYNSVSKKPVKYCAILKEKREFENLLENVFAIQLKNSCSIIDKKIATAKDKSNIEIVFLNQEEKDLLSLNLNVSKKHALRRRNNLLIFLKNNSNNLKYHIQDGSIYVKCDVNVQWHIFYNLFEFLLVRYGICNIGSLFYCVFFSGCMLKQEIRFLYCNPTDPNNSLYPFQLNLNENVISVAENNLSLTRKKFPKHTLYYQNYSNDSLVSTVSQELTFKILSDSIPNEKTMDKDSISNCTMPKRKIPRLNCSCSEIRCKCHESTWKLHKNISKYNVNCYMDILLKKDVTSTDELSIAQGELSFSSSFGHFSNQDLDSLLKNNIENSVPPVELSKRTDLLLGESQNGEAHSLNPVDQCRDSTVPVVTTITTRNKFEPKPESILKAINLLNEGVDKKENFSFLHEELSEKKKCTNSTASFNMFHTASGKKINISKTAMKTAEKMFTEVMQSEDDPLNDERTNVFAGRKCRTQTDKSPSVYNSTNQPIMGRDKHLNESIDGILVEGFFEDICFDENDEGLTDATQSSSICTNKYEQLTSVGKVRKSLGGRRSLKPYSVPKS